jgi:uncharacterized protein YkwD
MAAIVLAVVPALTVAAPASARSCAGANVNPAAQPREAAAATLCLLNQQRAARHLSALRTNGALTAAASRHSRDMAQRHFFSHTAPGNVSFAARIRAANYRPSGSWTIGENIGWGSGPLATPASIVRGWMNSPGHRANILNRSFRSIGIGVAPGAPYQTSAAVLRSSAIYTTDFGSR